MSFAFVWKRESTPLRIRQIFTHKQLKINTKQLIRAERLKCKVFR